MGAHEEVESKAMSATPALVTYHHENHLGHEYYRVEIRIPRFEFVDLPLAELRKKVERRLRAVGCEPYPNEEVVVPL